MGSGDNVRDPLSPGTAPVYGATLIYPDCHHSLFQPLVLGLFSCSMESDMNSPLFLTFALP